MTALVPASMLIGQETPEETKHQRTERLLKAAAAELYRLHQVIRAAQQAGMRPMPAVFQPPPSSPEAMLSERWIVDKADWERLQAMKKIIMQERC